MRRQYASIPLGRAASLQLVVCGAYAFALHLAETDEAGLVPRLMRAWVAFIDSKLRRLLFDATPETPCWRCHLMAFCSASIFVFTLWTRRNWPLWSQHIRAKLSRRGFPYARVASVITTGRVLAAMAATAALLFLFFPSATLGDDWYLVAAPIAASAASFCLAWFFVLTRLPS